MKANMENDDVHETKSLKKSNINKLKYNIAVPYQVFDMHKKTTRHTKKPFSTQKNYPCRFFVEK